jgi:signal transduction histidine kinase/integral membrane sensor domain MASE1
VEAQQQGAVTDANTHAKRWADGGLLPLRLGMVFFIPIVLAGSVLSAELRYRGLGSAVLFPPYAALTAVLVTSARRHWKWYVGVALLAHAVTSLPHWALTWILLADVANLARALTAAVLLQHLFDGPPRFDKGRVLLQFLAIAVVVAPALGAMIGAANVAWHEPSTSFWSVWSAWFTSSALTAMIMLPGLLVATTYVTTRRGVRVRRRRIVEALALTAALALTCTVAFALHAARPGDLTLLLFAPSPLLIWCALRFGHGGASLALTFVAGSAIWSADRGLGRFVSLSPDNHVLALQLFMLLTALPVLCVATIGAARRAEVQLHHALLASLQDHVAILDASGIVLEVNQSWQRYALREHSCPVDQIRVGDDFLAACRTAMQRPEPDRTRAACALAGVERVLAGASRRCDMEYEQCDEGPHQWFTVRIEALERADGGVVITRADVSARQRAQLEVEERRREVTHLARIGVLGQLSGALAHELRQPLSSILANAETAQRLLQRQPLDREELTTILHEIAIEDRHAAKVIDGLRAMLKRGEARVRAVETESLVSAVLAMARPELVARGVTVTTNLQPGLPSLLADAVQVQQVLLNLILNACEAMTESPAGRRTLLLTATARGERLVRISARDSGTGIPPALIPRLFEPFMTTKPEGLGLGLSISRTIVAAHGGRLWAENNADGGATVHCELPAAVRSHAVPTVQQRAPALTA